MKTDKQKFAGVLSFVLMFSICITLTTPTHADRIDDLNDPDFAVRRSTTEQLLTDTSITLEQLQTWLKRDGLTPEQTHRLLNIARHHLLLDRPAPKPDAHPIAMGFGHQPGQYLGPQGQPIGAVLVVTTLPGLPAHGRLRPGDLITHLNAVPLPPMLRPEEFAKHIAKLPPAQPVGLDLIRDEQTLRLEIPVTSLADLTRLYDEKSQLRQPYARKWAAFLDRVH